MALPGDFTSRSRSDSSGLVAPVGALRKGRDRHPAANPARTAEILSLKWSAYATNLIYDHIVMAKTRFFVIVLSH